MSRVAVTHADEPLGRRVVKALYHDPSVETLLALGSGPAPRAFDAFLADAPERFGYAQLDLARHRPVRDLFHGDRLRGFGIDTVVYLPAHHPGAEREVAEPAGLPRRTAEARLVLQACLEVPGIRHLVAVGSAFVYRLEPGNANRLTEESELDFDPELPVELRSLVDSDLIFQGEVHHDRLTVTLLRVPTVVAPGGYAFLSPLVPGPRGVRLRPLGYDPMCALLADKDLALAIRRAVDAGKGGIFHIAGVETVPLSTLCRWLGRPEWPVPGPLLGALAGAAEGLRLGLADALRPDRHLRFGFTLDTSRAERELGFRPRHRIGIGPAADGRPRLEITPC